MSDQMVRIEQQDIELLDDEVMRAVAESIEAGTPDIALDFAYQLARVGYLRGVQLAHLLYELSINWSKFQTDDTFEDAVLKNVGRDAKTVRKYVEMYRWVLKPHPELIGKPVRALIELTAAAREGEFTDEHWAEIADATDAAAIIDVRRKARGTYGRGHSRLTAWITRDGFIQSKRGDDGPIEDRGYWDVNDDDPDNQVLLDRLEKAGFIRQ